MKATNPAKSDHPIFPGRAHASRAGFGALASALGACAPPLRYLLLKHYPAAVISCCMVAGSLSPQQISDLLATSGYWQNFQPDELALLVYDELRQLAHRCMRGERPDYTLQPTALVDEAYLHRADQTDPHWQNRTHFFAAAARMMRHILVDHARRRNRAKRGAGAVKIELSDDAIVTETPAGQLVDLKDARAPRRTGSAAPVRW